MLEGVVGGYLEGLEPYELEERICCPTGFCFKVLLSLTVIFSGVAALLIYLLTISGDETQTFLCVAFILVLGCIVSFANAAFECFRGRCNTRAETPTEVSPYRGISPIPGQERNDNTEPVVQIPAQPSQSSLAASEDAEQPSSQPSATGSLSGDRRGKAKPDQKESGSEPFLSQKQVQASISGESSSISKLLDVASAVSQIAMKDIVNDEGELETGGTEKASSDEQQVSKENSPEGEKVATNVRQRRSISPK